MVHEQLSDRCHLDLEPFGFESACNLFQTAMRMMNQVNQYHDRLHIGGHPGRRGDNLGQSGMPLLVADFWVSGKPNPSSHDFLSTKRWMVAKGRKKRTRLQPEEFA
jgi:hypothetical protein